MVHEQEGILCTPAELVRSRHPNARVRITPTSRVQSRNAGPYDSTFRGRGMEFDETRQYQAGDDIRTIDWRVTARTGRVHTKLFHEERERPVLFLVDQRSAMRFGTRRAFKSVQAARTTAMLAWAARDAGDRVGGILLTTEGHAEIRPQGSRERLMAFLHRIADATGSTETAGHELTLAEGLARLERVARPGTLVFVLSDFRDLDDDAESALIRLSLRADVACLRVFDALEETVPEADGLKVSDGVRVHALGGRDPVFRRAWEGRFHETQERLDRLCRSRRMGFFALRTDDDPHALLESPALAHAFHRTSEGGPR